MTPIAILWRGAGLALGLACASAAYAQPYYHDAPVDYPWRNGVIEGPAVIGPGPQAGPPGGYDPNAYPGGGGPVDPSGAPGYPAGYTPGGGYGQPGYAPGYGGPGYGGSPGYGGAGYGYPAGGFPAPDEKGGTITVTQGPDGRILVTRFAPVWTSEVGPNGWAHRHYYHYGWPGSGWRPFN